MATLSIENPLLFFINVVVLSVLLFTIHLLLLRSVQRQVYLPLAMCLLCIGIVMCQPALQPVGIQWRIVFLILALPAILLLPPCLWFYAKGLTSEQEWRFTQESRWHWVMPGGGAFIAIFALLLPWDLQYQMLALGDENAVEQLDGVFQYLLKGMLLLTLFLVLGWILQSGFYFIKTIGLLNQYRLRLKDIFASTDNREIKWLTWLLIAVGIVWLGTAINLVLDNLLFDTHPDPVWVNLIVLVMVWSLSVWGLRQKPGFEDLYVTVPEDQQAKPREDSADQTLQNQQMLNQESHNPAMENTASDNPKYQRSALSEQQSSRIAGKIKGVMESDRLYLDSSISLQKLAKHTATSSNYISQTLNETLGLNFFDFVNGYRVEAAKRLLRESDDSILDIAMNVGFNAKSSFYSAFKKETQQTPSQYRKSKVLP